MDSLFDWLTLADVQQDFARNIVSLRMSQDLFDDLSSDPAHRLLADNRLARHQYDILETLECGIELLGTEVKSIRAGQCNLRDGFCLIRNGEMQLHNVHISPHSHAGRFFNHEPLRVRRLLAHRREIDKLRVAL